MSHLYPFLVTTWLHKCIFWEQAFSPSVKRLRQSMVTWPTDQALKCYLRTNNKSQSICWTQQSGLRWGSFFGIDCCLYFSRVFSLNLALWKQRPCVFLYNKHQWKVGLSHIDKNLCVQVVMRWKFLSLTKQENEKPMNTNPSNKTAYWQIFKSQHSQKLILHIELQHSSTFPVIKKGLLPMY